MIPVFCRLSTYLDLVSRWRFTSINCTYEKDIRVISVLFRQYKINIQLLPSWPDMTWPVALPILCLLPTLVLSGTHQCRWSSLIPSSLPPGTVFLIILLLFMYLYIKYARLKKKIFKECLLEYFFFNLAHYTYK